MKKKIVSLLMLLCLTLLTGCGLNLSKEDTADFLTPDDFEPIYYTAEAELPEDAYYIVHKETDEGGNTYTKYYPLHQAEKTYDETREKQAGYDSSRVVWVNYNHDEGLIPTMYQGDELIYKSSTYIPTKYALEKFFDNGYTFGVCGLEQDLSENYKYTSAGDSGKGYVMTTSDATGFDALNAESIYFVAVGDTRVTPANISLSGTITGLNLMDSYICDIRTGTQKLEATLTCNVHYFSSAETYMFGSFSFITDIIARLNIPDYVTTGYYEISDGGFFRYIADEQINDYHALAEDDYNKTIYTYDDEGYVNGTTVGLIFDKETGFLVENNVDVDTTNVEGASNSYSDIIAKNNATKTITNKTSLNATSNGTYTGTYVIDEISEPTITSTGYEYKLTCTSEEETINLKYVLNAVNKKVTLNDTITVTFKETDDDFDGYSVVTISKITSSESTEELTEETTNDADGETEVIEENNE